ncbi:hypothetical protein HK097_008647 [Rhizophlyctis rosea]|uniref:Coiled-coil domain-containing protein 148 n=1 Tax=Rhizophlyctis rosea TaxID=64517 RepID=A0AAD5X981_9FUNG|nr:hypothetical protein HK097_008647 [Rhizophlyctis rosea]
MPADVDVLLIKLNRSHLPAARSPVGGKAALNKLKNSTRGMGKKLEKLEQSSKDQAATTSLRKHRAVWADELARLERWRREIHDDISAFAAHGGRGDDDVLKVADVFEEMDCLGSGQTQLQEGGTSHDPLNVVFGALRRRLAEINDKIQEALAFVKAARQKLEDQTCSQSAMSALLASREYLNTLQKELDDQYAEIQADMRSTTPLTKTTTVFDEDITDPWIVYHDDILRFSDLHCVDEEVEAERRSTFASILEWYKHRMADLQSTYPDVIHDPYDGWTEDDHIRFCKIRDEYATEIHRRHLLVLERLRMEFPGVCRNELLRHEDMSSRSASYQAQKQSIRKAFKGRIAQCIEMTKEVYQEATKLHQQYQSTQSERLNQLSKLAKEHDQLRIWREQKIAQLKILEAQRAKEMEDKLAKAAEEHRKEEHRRHQDKQRIKFFHDEQNRQSLLQTQMLEKIRAAEEAERIEQSKYNEERSQYRHTKVLAKIEERRKSVEALEAAKMESLRRLEALRESVAVHADSDWERILSDTKAVSHAKEAVEEPPLFKNNSFTVEHVLKDRRAKLALALHDRGLSHNSYAREMLQSLGPAGPVRRDMKSTVNFS